MAENTEPRLNEELRRETDARLALLDRASDSEVRARLAEVGREWDVERVLQMNAGTLASLGTLLGLTVDRRFLIVPGAVFGFLSQHSLQGWCPPLPILRRLGVRTAREIGRERAALKAMRGDFGGMDRAEGAHPVARVEAALRSVDL